MNMIRVSVGDGPAVEHREHIEVGNLAPPPPDPGLPWLGALVNNDASSLSYPLTVNSQVRFLNMSDSHGWRIYRRSLSFLLARTARQVLPELIFAIEHSFGPGIYASCHDTDGNSVTLTSDQVDRVSAAMRATVSDNLPIERRKIAYADAVAEFDAAGDSNRLNLLRHRNTPRVVLHCCGGYFDLAHGPLAPSTGLLGSFELLPYPPGMVLNMPTRETPQRTDPFEDQPHLFQIFREHKRWGRILGVNTVGRLNETIASQEIEDLVLTAEALHEKKLSAIADRIAEERGRVKLVLIAGPSCAGKTTFAKRLSSHLRVNGLRPVTLAGDDYFVGEKDNPLDETGKPDYEHIEAVDLPLFNRHLLDLVEGREIEIPKFNFTTKCRERSGRRLRIADDQIILIEGIHGLNPRLTELVPADRELKIYINALTQLSLDKTNRVSTTDNRLMRRIVRDSKFRGYSPLQTLRNWPSVRRGEKQWIFPFQREAQVTFNSALDYELAVLKPLVEPLLMQVKPMHPEYAEARRLSEFLLNFIPAPERTVPGHSILREYIGGSTLQY